MVQCHWNEKMHLGVSEGGKCMSSQVELVFSLSESPAQTSQDRISLCSARGTSLGMAGVGELPHCPGEGSNKPTVLLTREDWLGRWREQCAA